MPGPRERRELVTALLGSAAAGGLALMGAGQTWLTVTVVREPPLPPVEESVSGSQALPLVPATGLVLLAAALALVAVRGGARRVVGLLMAVAGGVLGWSGVRGLTGGLVPDVDDLDSLVGLGAARLDVAVHPAWPVLALVAAVLAVAAGLFVVVRGNAWPGMGRGYERTPAAPGAAPRAQRPLTDEDRHQAAWKALDRGEDPTA